MATTYLPLPHAYHAPAGIPLQQAHLSQELEFTVHFQNDGQRDTGELQERAKKAFLDKPSTRAYLNREELTALTGPAETAIQEVSDYFAGFSIEQVELHRLHRSATYRGSIGDINRALKTVIKAYQGDCNNVITAYDGALHLPATLHRAVKHISDILPPHKKESRPPTITESFPATGAPALNGGYSVQQLMKAYSFPESLTGKGQCIALVELGGQYKRSDVITYFQKARLPLPRIEEVGRPINTNSLLDNSEVTLDIQVVGTIAPDATLVVYYGSTILEAMQLILQDTQYHPTVVSISWAGSEYNYSAFDIAELDQAFHQASLLGMTILAASGDQGALNGRGFPNVSIPSSHPLVIGCGGSAPLLNEEDKITFDTVWDQNNGQSASGGGFSELYPLPPYQQGATNSYPYARTGTRGVPDVAANASGANGYQVVFNGREMPIGGTSAATPLWAGLIALISQSLGHPLGYIHPYLYQLAGSEGFLPIVQGNNGYYPAYPYWNPATGLGGPNGARLLQLLRELL